MQFYIALLSVHSLILVILQFISCIHSEWKECSSYSPPATVILLLFLGFEALLFAIFTSIMLGTQLNAIWNDETVSTLDEGCCYILDPDSLLTFSFDPAGYWAAEEGGGEVDPQVPLEELSRRFRSLQYSVVLPIYPATPGWQEAECLFVCSLKKKKKKKVLFTLHHVSNITKAKSKSVVVVGIIIDKCLFWMAQRLLKWNFHHYSVQKKKKWRTFIKKTKTYDSWLIISNIEFVIYWYTLSLSSSHPGVFSFNSNTNGCCLLCTC